MRMKKKLFVLSISFLIIIAIYLAFPFILEGMGRFLVVREEPVPSDVILVLAGDDNGERVAEGVNLYKQGYADKIIMSGGPLAWKLTSAEWMKKQAVAMGVPAQNILLQKESRSTLEDVVFSLALIEKHGFKSVILVTSPYHARRAKRIFKRASRGRQIKVVSCPVRESGFRVEGWWSRHEDTSYVIREYMAMVYYFFKGY